MEYLNTIDEIIPQRISGSVIANGEVVNTFDLSINDINIKMPLNELREYLTRMNLVLVGIQNSNFRNKFEYKIPVINENEYKLNDILVSTYSIDEPDSFSFFIEKDLIRPGFPEIVRILNITNGCIIMQDNIVTTNKSAFYIKNPHLMEVIIHQNLEQIEDTGKTKFHVRCEKGTIRLLPADLVATEEYVQAIEDALDKDLNPDPRDARDALIKVGRDYGIFWPKEIKLGGEFQMDEQTENIEELENLKHYKNWKVIKRSDLTSLYKLLPEWLITKIKEAIGMKVLHLNNLSVNMPKGYNSLIKRIPKPSGITTFNGVKIFASVIVLNEARPYRNSFAIRIEYINDGSPYLVIHRIFPAKKTFNLFIPYMLIGYKEELPTENFSNALNYIYTIRFLYNGNNQIEHPNLENGYCIIGCPVLKCSDNPSYNFGKSKDAISFHFHRRNERNGTELCCECYDIQNEQIINELVFEVNCAVIEKNTPGFEVFEPTEQKWEYKNYNLPLFRRKNRTFTGNRWQLFKQPKTIFASIHHSNHPHFLNIHKKYPIAKSLTVIPDNLRSQIGYVIVDSNALASTNTCDISKSIINRIGDIHVKKNVSNDFFNQSNTKYVGTSTDQEENEKIKFSQFKNIESLQPIFNEDIIKFFKLNYGLIINSQTMFIAVNPAFNIFKKINPKINHNESCDAKIISSKSRNETFLLENDLDSGSFWSLPSNLINIMMQSINLCNDSSVNDIRLEIKCQRIILNIEREAIQPTENIKIAVNNALKSQEPYQKLIKVFNIYGYFLSQEIILGEKLYEMSYNSLNEIVNDNEPFKIDLSKLDKLFTSWKTKYKFDASYLMSSCGEAVKKEDTKKWIEDYYKKSFKTLQIINRDKLFPIYEIFEPQICCEIESILGIKNENKILMTGIIQIIENTKYYHESFPVRLNSSNYQIFANMVRTNEQSNNVINEAFVKIQSATKTGFLAIIENFDKIRNIEPVELQIMWMLTGLPNEINYFSVHTRKLSILSMKNQEIESEKTSILLDIKDDYPKTSRIALSFEFLLSQDKSTDKENQIKLNIDYGPLYNDISSDDIKYENNESGSDDYSSNTSEESQERVVKYSLYSCIFVSDEGSIKTDISTNGEKYINMKTIGLSIG
ncbi:Sel1 repeat domain-containing protein [Gigaspora margarita]|uniref:Sel1 repeat domain-containing protein n=1 Tax=Gigaspora margarita TaxID=4874 RepID=A0A8H3X033_GIGMA|nr:Sel1 repeat domain-containing protein [Gigaspora margarita]